MTAEREASLSYRGSAIDHDLINSVIARRTNLVADHWQAPTLSPSPHQREHCHPQGTFSKQLRVQSLPSIAMAGFGRSRALQTRVSAAELWWKEIQPE